MINADKAIKLYTKDSLFNDKENIMQENIIADLNARGFAPAANQ
jgi:hypothetical protein